MDDILEACVAELDEYTRPGGTLNLALLTLGEVPSMPGKGWRIQQTCRRIHLTKKNGSILARYMLTPTDSHDLAVPRPAVLKETEQAVCEVAELLRNDMTSRFAHTGILQYVYVLKPEWGAAQPGGGSDADLRSAMGAWGKHFGFAAEVLLHQWSGLHASRLRQLVSDPGARLAPVHAFWPPLLAQHAQSARELCHCIAAFIAMLWQNAQVERDLAIIKKVHERAQGQLGQTRLDSRVRVELVGPPPDKARGQRVKGVIKTIAKEWVLRKRRQHAPAPAMRRGPQGKLPQRARVCHPGPLTQAVQPILAAGQGATAHESEMPEEAVDMGALLQ